MYYHQTWASFKITPSLNPLLYQEVNLLSLYPLRPTTFVALPQHPDTPHHDIRQVADCVTWGMGSGISQKQPMSYHFQGLGGEKGDSLLDQSWQLTPTWMEKNLQSGSFFAILCTRELRLATATSYVGVGSSHDNSLSAADQTLGRRVEFVIDAGCDGSSGRFGCLGRGKGDSFCFCSGQLGRGLQDCSEWLDSWAYCWCLAWSCINEGAEGRSQDEWANEMARHLK